MKKLALILTLSACGFNSSPMENWPDGSMRDAASGGASEDAEVLTSIAGSPGYMDPPVDDAGREEDPNVRVVPSGDGDGDGDGGVACTDCTPIERGVEAQCPEGGCDFVCPGSYECTARCEGGGCTMTGCAEDGYCSLSCRGGGCAIECDQWVDVCGYYGPHTTCTGLGCPEEVVADCAAASNTTCGESIFVSNIALCGTYNGVGHVPPACSTASDCTALTGSVCQDLGEQLGLRCLKECSH